MLLIAIHDDVKVRCRALIVCEGGNKNYTSFDDTCYATHDPCTMVYKLVRLLRGEDKEFNKKIMKGLIE